MEGATTQEQAVRSDVTIQASREPHVSMAASAHAMDPRPSYGLWGGLRGGLLTDIVQNLASRPFYSAYPHVTSLSQAYPASSVFTWILIGHDYLKLPVPSVWSNDATSFYCQLESQCPGAMEPSAFPCFMSLLPPHSSVFPTHAWNIPSHWPSWGPGANQLSQAYSEEYIPSPSFRGGLGQYVSDTDACQSNPQMPPHFLQTTSSGSTQQPQLPLPFTLQGPPPPL